MNFTSSALAAKPMSRLARVPLFAQILLLVALLVAAAYLWSASWRTERFYQKATLTQLQAAAARRPNDPRVLHYLALRFQDAGQLQEALDAALRAAELAPFDEDAYLMAAAFSGRAHGDQGAFDILNEFAQRNPKSARVHRALALLYQKNGAHERAFAEAIKATKADATDPDSFRIAADEARVMHKTDAAEPNARRAVALAPNDPRAHLTLASVLDIMGRPADARAAAEAAVKAAPQNGAARFFLGDLLRRQNRPQEALVQLNEALRLLPDNGDSQREIGRILLAQGKYADAKESLEQARAALPDDSTVAFLLTATYKRLGDAPAATREEARFAALRAYRDRVSEIKLNLDKGLGDEVRLRRDLAQLLAFHDDIAGARQQYRLLILRHPDAAYVRHELAALNAFAGGDEQTGKRESRLASLLYAADRAIFSNQAERIVAALEAAIKANPGEADLHNRLGRALGQAIGLEDQAEGAMIQATQLEPKNADFALDAAEMLARNKKLDAAEAEYRRALTLAPKDPKTQGAMGRFLANDCTEAAKNAEGERLLRDLLTSDPANADALFGLGTLALTRSDGKTAAEYFESFLSKTGQREWPDLYFGLARAYQLAGNAEKAAQARAVYTRLTTKSAEGSGP